MDYKKVHFVGIGGIGMSALAQLYAAQGSAVTGSGKEESPTTRLLRTKGVDVYIGHFAAQVPEGAELLVYSDAVPADNAERVYAAKNSIPQQSYFEALGSAAEGKRVVAIAGTNGKTTTTAMIGKILIDAEFDPTVIVGSIVKDFGLNRASRAVGQTELKGDSVLGLNRASRAVGQTELKGDSVLGLNRASRAVGRTELKGDSVLGSNFRRGKSDIFVVEACEYRRHFLVFHPEVLVVTNIEWDHTDYFKTPEELKEAFAEARGQAKTVVDAGVYGKESVPELLVPGEFNRESARAAKAAVRAITPGISEATVDQSLASYQGVWRRFEYKGVLPGGAELYDDYAHHPTAIRRTIEAARQKFPGKRIVVVFHPHLYSRTRDLFEGFADALAQADEVYLLPVYAAREASDPTFDHAALVKAVNARDGKAEVVAAFEAVTKVLSGLENSAVALTMGAGDVYKVGEQTLRKT